MANTYDPTILAQIFVIMRTPLNLPKYKPAASYILHQQERTVSSARFSVMQYYIISLWQKSITVGCVTLYSTAIRMRTTEER